MRHWRRADERDGLDLRRCEEGLHRLPRSVHHIQHAGGESCFLEDLGQADRTQRRPLRRLQDKGIPRHDCQGHHPQRDHDRKVEGRNTGHHAQGIAIQILVHAPGDLPQRAALQQGRRPTRKVHHLDPAPDLPPGLVQGLAMVAGDEGCQLLSVFLEQRFIAEHEPRALHHRGLRPPDIRLRRGRHRLGHLRGSRERDLIEYVFRGRVVDRECRRVRVAPVTGDQIGNHGHSSSWLYEL